MKTPFEGVVGKSIELRIIEFMLPLEGVEMSVSDFVEFTGVGRKAVSVVVNKFERWGIFELVPGCEAKYIINPNSPIVMAIDEMNNAIIGLMVFGEVKKHPKRYCRLCGGEIDDIGQYPKARLCGKCREMHRHPQKRNRINYVGRTQNYFDKHGWPDFVAPLRVPEDMPEYLADCDITNVSRCRAMRACLPVIVRNTGEHYVDCSNTTYRLVPK